MTTVEQVHREFLTASETMMETYSKQKGRLLDKINRLAKLGFVNSQDAQKLPDLESVEVLAQLIEQYSISHPNNKIISKRDVKRLCEKYGLIVGRIENFTGFVPEKNLREIEAFYHKDYNTWVLYDEHRSVVGEYFTEIAVESALNNLVKAKEEERLAKEEREAALRSRGHDFYSVSLRMSLWNMFSSPEYRRKGDFSIAAPKADMKVRQNEVVINNEIVHVPDPVVLFPIHADFFLIVTAWGDEASDPLVVNEKFN